MQNIIVRLLVISVSSILLLANVAHSDCIDPYNPAIERTDLSIKHNSYAEESEICITEKAEYCDHCAAGY